MEGAQPRRRGRVMTFEFDPDGPEDQQVVFRDVGGGDAAGALFWREVRAHAEVGAVEGAPAVGRWLAWLRGVWWRVDPRLHLGRIRVRVTLWWDGVARRWEGVDWPLVRRGLFAFARAFVFMMLLVLRQQGYHFLPQLTIPFELPRDSYLRRLQGSFHFWAITLLKVLCTLYGASGVVAVLVGLRMVDRYHAMDYLYLVQEGDQDLAAPALPQNALHIGEGLHLVIPRRIRWVPLVAVMLLMLGAVFLINPTTEAQEPPPT